MVAIVLLSLGCARARKKEPMANALFLKQVHPTYIVTHQRWLELSDDDAFPQIPKVTLNGEQLPLARWNPIQAIYADSVPFPVDTSYLVRIEHYWGEASSRVYMPGSFRINGPDSNYVLDRDSLLVIHWGPARGATWYWLNLFLDYDYLDTLYEWDYYEFDRDTIVFDTICVYERNRFFPWFVRRILEGEGEAVVWACDGPVMLPGALGNVEGDGFGYVNTANQPREAYFVVVQPPVMRRSPGDATERSRAKFLRRLKEMHQQ